jgi:hypothetical protein
MPKTNCPLYNKGLYIEKINQADAHVGMCCFQTLSSESYDSIDFYDNEYLTKIRTSTDEVSACSKCFDNERAGNQSYRQGQLLAFAQQGITVDNQTELKSFSYNCESVCNLKCITCGPKFSSLWRPEYAKLGYPVTEIKSSGKHNRIFESLDLSQVELMHFQGGEPLLTEDHELILKQIADQGDLSRVIVSYNTNATVFPTDATVELWKQTKLTKLYFSIDGTGDQFEYIRFPGKWSQVEENMQDIRDLNFPSLWLELGVTIGLANLFYLQDIIDWRDQNFATLHNGDPINMIINFVAPMSRGGDVLGLDSANDSIRTAAFEYLDTLTDQSIASAVRGWLESCKPNNSNEWVKYLDDIDQLRNTNWRKSLPRLAAHV